MDDGWGYHHWWNPPVIIPGTWKMVYFHPGHFDRRTPGWSQERRSPSGPPGGWPFPMAIYHHQRVESDVFETQEFPYGIPIVNCRWVLAPPSVLLKWREASYISPFNQLKSARPDLEHYIFRRQPRHWYNIDQKLKVEVLLWVQFRLDVFVTMAIGLDPNLYGDYLPWLQPLVAPTAPESETSFFDWYDQGIAI